MENRRTNKGKKMRTKPPKPTKWTEDRVLRELTSMRENLGQRRDVYFLGELFRDKPYTLEYWSIWTKKFKNPLTQMDLFAEEGIKPKDFVSERMIRILKIRNGKRGRIVQAIKKIEDLIHANLFDAGLKDKINQQQVKLTLQTKYNYTVPQVIHQTNTNREQGIREAEAEKQRLDKERADEVEDNSE